MSELQELSAKVLKNFQGNMVVALLCLFLVLELFSLTNTARSTDNLLQVSDLSGTTNVDRPSQYAVPAKVPKISEIKGPRIDDGAATIVAEGVSSAQTQTQTLACFSLPTGVWVFLLVAYIALLVFNLAYNFQNVTRVQWVWELGLTLLTLLTWFLWDECRTSPWFPLAVLKMGVLIYALYLYFFEMQQGRKPEQTESLF
jgi:hypothetical protein